MTDAKRGHHDGAASDPKPRPGKAGPGSRTARGWILAVSAPVALLAGLGLARCTHASPAEGASECACAGGEPIVDATLLAFLSKARAAHHRADLLLEDGDVDLAIEALEPVVGGPRPAAAPEAVEVVADTYARLADLKSDLGHIDPALRDVEAGLALASQPTHFRGHLLDMKGVVLERRYRALDAMGETDAASAAKAEALEAFKSAIDVEEQVINEALSRIGH